MPASVADAQPQPLTARLPAAFLRSALCACAPVTTPSPRHHVVGHQAHHAHPLDAHPLSTPPLASLIPAHRTRPVAMRLDRPGRSSHRAHRLWCEPSPGQIREGITMLMGDLTSRALTPCFFHSPHRFEMTPVERGCQLRGAIAMIAALIALRGLPGAAPGRWRLGSPAHARLHGTTPAAGPGARCSSLGGPRHSAAPGLAHSPRRPDGRSHAWPRRWLPTPATPRDPSPPQGSLPVSPPARWPAGLRRTAARCVRLGPAPRPGEGAEAPPGRGERGPVSQGRSTAACAPRPPPPRASPRGQGTDGARPCGCGRAVGGAAPPPARLRLAPHNRRAWRRDGAGASRPRSRSRWPVSSHDGSRTRPARPASGSGTAPAVPAPAAGPRQTG